MLLISKPNEERFIWQIRIPVTFVFPALSSGILLLPKRKHWSLFIVRLKPAEQLSPTLSPADDESVFERKKLPPSHVWMPPQCLKSSFSRIRCSKTRLLCPLQLSKTNTQYHKLFKDVSRDELLIKSRYRIQIISHNVGKKWMCWAASLDVCVKGYTCALQRDILYQGKMFVSDNWICFHSKVFGRDTKVRSLTQLRLCCGRLRHPDISMFPNHQISIPVPSVTFIKKTKTALLVPNALVIETASCQVRTARRLFPVFQVNGNLIPPICCCFSFQHVFVSFLSRNTTYKFLKSVCFHLEVFVYPNVPSQLN